MDRSANYKHLEGPALRLRFRFRQGCGGRAGQAMAEFLVGLVAIMLLVAGLQQIAFLSQRGYAAMNNARLKMAGHLMDPSFAGDALSNFAFGDPTRPGSDRKNYTADDRRAYGNDTFYQVNDGYLEKVRDADIEGYFAAYDFYNPNNDLKQSDVYSRSTALEMFHTSDQQSVDVVPFLNRVLGRETILIGSDIVMPRLDRVME